jgi:hypothetical protein
LWWRNVLIRREKPGDFGRSLPMIVKNALSLGGRLAQQ